MFSFVKPILIGGAMNLALTLVLDKTQSRIDDDVESKAAAIAFTLIIGGLSYLASHKISAKLITPNMKVLPSFMR